MPGEQLEPVVARVEIDDSDFLGGLDRDVAALRSAAGEIEALLASLDIGAGLASSLSGADLASLNTDEIAQGLSEQMAGVGAALAEDLGTEFGQGLAAAGVGGGHALADGVSEGASGVGDVVAADLGESLVAPLEAAGAEAGTALEQGMVDGLSGLGQQVGAQVSSDLSSLHDAAGSAGASAGHALAAGVQAGLAPLGGVGAAAGAQLSAGIASGAASAAGSVGEVARAVEAQLVDALGDAGAVAGAALTAGVALGGAAAGAGAADSIARGIEAQLGDALGEAGASAGVSLASGISDGAQAVAGQAAARIAEQIEAPLVDAMAGVGTSAAVALAEGIEQSAGVIGEAVGAELELGVTSGTTAGDWVKHVNIADMMARQLAEESPEIEREVAESVGGAMAAGMDQAGQAALSMRRSGPRTGPSATAIPATGFESVEAALAAQAGAAEDTWAKHVNVADIVARQMSEATAELVPSFEQLARYTEQGVELWGENVAAAIAEEGPVLGEAFTAAMRDVFANVDLAGLTEAQAAALTAAMEGRLPEYTAAGAKVAGAVGDGIAAGASEAESSATAFSDELEAAIAQALAVTAPKVEAAAGSIAASAERGLSPAESDSAWFFDMWERQGSQAARSFTTGLDDIAGDNNAARIFQNLANQLPAPFVEAYSQIRVGIEPTEQAMGQFSEYGQRQITTLRQVIETQSVAAADALVQNLGSRAWNDESIGPRLMAEASGVEAVGASAEKAGEGGRKMGGGMGMALMSLTAVASIAPMAIQELQKISGEGDHAAVSAQGVEAAMVGVSSTVTGTNMSLNTLIAGLGGLSNGAGGAVAGLADVDQALTSLQQTDPGLAAEEAAKVEHALEATGMSAKDAQKALSSYNAAVQETQIQLAAEQHAIEDTVPGTQAYTDAVEQSTIQLEQQALQAQETAQAQQQYLSTVTPGTEAWTNAVNANATSLAFQGQQASISADAQRKYLSELTPGTQQYAYALNAEQTQLISSASSARINAEALNSLLPAQARLGTEALNAAQAYNEVQQATSEYTGALQALHGMYGDTSAAEATFTTDLANAKGTITDGKDAVDQYTAAGAKNVTAFQQLSSQAITVAGDIYEQTGSAQQANTALQHMATQIDTLATKSGLTKTQVQQLNVELWGVKNIGSISVPINADTSGATRQLAGLMNRIDTSVGEITVRLMDNGNLYGNLKGPLAARASGGPVQAGVTYTVNEQGAERFTPQTDGFITAHSALGSDSGGGGGTVLHQHFYIEGSLIHRDDLSDASRQGTLQFQQRNSYSGLTYA